MDPRDAELDGLVFAGVSNTGDGDVDGRTQFRYHQEGATIWAEYRGGDVARGYLVGTREGAGLDFRYVHLDGAGRTATGRCTSRIVVSGGGLLQLHEDWAWESREGAGHSVVEEMRVAWSNAQQRI